MKSVLVVVIVAGCVWEVPAGRHPVGPLHLETRVETSVYGVREQVGQVQYTGADGSPAGTAAVYADRTAVESHHYWRPMEGDRALADEDFFRAVGDEPAALASHAYRRRGRWLLRGAVLASALEIAAIIVGAVANHPTVSELGGIGLATTFWVGYYGYADQHPDTHAVPYSRADDDLQQFHAIAP